ncbi:hypothetical protein FUSPEROL_00803 [Fusobacterium periodonticum ATCC 33693]|uniref:Uncharacterized protein n=1 Tax=Fusobacterium periodonticum ATCC 33693 TaxID=546275 RepID=D4CTT0_9FUSO|nr:hypothetical protein FUSPEROL_00803 [Fusobacterium periodonticum ATCC 33693]
MDYNLIELREFLRIKSLKILFFILKKLLFSVINVTLIVKKYFL